LPHSLSLLQLSRHFEILESFPHIDLELFMSVVDVIGEGIELTQDTFLLEYELRSHVPVLSHYHVVQLLLIFLRSFLVCSHSVNYVFAETPRVFKFLLEFFEFDLDYVA